MLDEMNMSRQLFFKLQGTIINLGNKLTVFRITLKLSLLKLTLFKNYKKVQEGFPERAGL